MGDRELLTIDVARSIHRTSLQAAQRMADHLKRLKGEYLKTQASAKAMDGSVQTAKLKARKMRFLPIYGGILHKRATALEIENSKIRERLRTIQAMGKRAEQDQKKLAALCRSAVTWSKVNAPIPQDLAPKAEIIRRRANMLQGSAQLVKPKVIQDVFALAREFDDIVRATLKQSSQARPVQQKPVQAPAVIVQKPKPVEAPTPVLQIEDYRVWLPVRNSKRTIENLVGMGARLDETVEWGTKLWVPHDQIGNIPDNYLPLMHRSRGAGLTFPPISPHAVGQNLWSIFDKPTWDHIRSELYRMTNYSCRVCGGRVREVFDLIAPERDRESPSPVDCHEVWDWNVKHPDQSVGIQKLDRFLVVCKDCHMMFHEGYWARRADEAGFDANDFREKLNEIREAVNHVDRQTLEHELEAAREQWNDAKDVGTWIMDLSALAGESFMADFVPTLRADNRAGVTEDMIAGIAFRTEDGREFNAASPEDLAQRAATARQGFKSRNPS